VLKPNIKVLGIGDSSVTRQGDDAPAGLTAFGDGRVMGDIALVVALAADTGGTLRFSGVLTNWRAMLISSRRLSVDFEGFCA